MLTLTVLCAPVVRILTPLLSALAAFARRHMPIAIVNLVDSGFSLPETRRLRRELESAKVEADYLYRANNNLVRQNREQRAEILSMQTDIHRLIDEGGKSHE